MTKFEELLAKHWRLGVIIVSWAILIALAISMWHLAGNPPQNCPKLLNISDVLLSQNARIQLP